MTKNTTAPTAPQVELRPLAGLVGYARNARTHDAAQVAQLKSSIVEFGFTNPLLADAAGIVAGHGRSMALRELYAAGVEVRFPNGAPIPLGMAPVIDCTGWSTAQRRAYILADNQLALNAGWDLNLLKIEIDDLKAEGFDIELTGFAEIELDAMFAEPGEGEGGGSDPEGEEDPYSRKIEAPVYTPAAEQPPVAALYDDTKARALVAAIRAADLPSEIADFLEKAAERHTVFNFAQVADFYAHAEAPLQRLMEDSALVIVDFNRAIENGFVKLTKRLGAMVERDYPDEG